MTITALGSLSVGAAVPGMAAAITAGMTGIDKAIPTLQAQIAALNAFAPLPVDFASTLALAQATVASVQAAIAGGLPAPSLDVQVQIVAAELALLLQALAAAQAQVTILTGLQNKLAAAGISAFAFTGAASALGGELGNALAGWTGSANALALVTSNTATWQTMSSVFKVTT